MKKLYLILVFTLLANFSFAQQSSQNLDINPIDAVTGFAIFIALIPFYVVIGCISVVTGVAGIAATMVALPIVHGYYEAKDSVLNATVDRFVETNLCQAAKDLNVNFDDSRVAKGYYSSRIYTHNRSPNNYTYISKLEPFFKDKNKLSKENNFLCFQHANSNCLDNFVKDTTTQATGVWKPPKAFSYDGESFIQLRKTNADGTYYAATAKFANVVKYFNYNNHYIFNADASVYSVKDLCPMLRRISIHELATKKDV